MGKRINFMSWNTSLYMQKKEEEIEIKKEDNETMFKIIKKHCKEYPTDVNGGIAILQEIPYKNNRREPHPIFTGLQNLCADNDLEMKSYWIDKKDCEKNLKLMQTVVIASKDLIMPIDIDDAIKDYRNRHYYFNVAGINCWAVHACDAFALREWMAECDIHPDMIAGDMNSGNYVLSCENDDRKISVNRKNYLMLSERYIDIFQGQITTNYKNAKEQRQIDHVLIENSEKFRTKCKYTNVRVDKLIDLSDHFPLYWTLEINDECLEK